MAGETLSKESVPRSVVLEKPSPRLSLCKTNRSFTYVLSDLMTHSAEKYSIKNAEIEGNYRYVLHAETSCSGDKRLAVIQINPSLASNARSDATVGKVANWAQRQGYKQVVFLNLFAYIHPHQDEIPNLPYTILVGPRNDEIIRKYAHPGYDVIAAWGRPAGLLRQHYAERLSQMKELLSDLSILHIGGLSYGRFPRHGRAWNKKNDQKNKLHWNTIHNEAL